LRIVSGLAEHTHSIFCDGPQGSETVNGCPVLRRQEPSPRGTPASCGFCPSSPCALLRSAPQENLFPLTKTYMEVGNSGVDGSSNFLSPQNSRLPYATKTAS